MPRSKNLSAKGRRNKGSRVEREIVAMHQAIGVDAERVPLSGGAGGSYTGDVIVDKKYRAEVKARKEGVGFVLLNKWLKDNDMLILKQDRTQPLVVLPWTTYSELMEKIDR
tara:strand:- start:3463 stop:3795 length:333 start_codon:yes stop_codon:yes gene_type:complete